jgi:hypothetical protein
VCQWRRVRNGPGEAIPEARRLKNPPDAAKLRTPNKNTALS